MCVRIYMYMHWCMSSQCSCCVLRSYNFITFVASSTASTGLTARTSTKWSIHCHLYPATSEHSSAVKMCLWLNSSFRTGGKANNVMGMNRELCSGVGYMQCKHIQKPTLTHAHPNLNPKPYSMAADSSYICREVDRKYPHTHVPPSDCTHQCTHTYTHAHTHTSQVYRQILLQQLR